MDEAWWKEATKQVEYSNLAFGFKRRINYT